MGVGEFTSAVLRLEALGKKVKVKHVTVYGGCDYLFLDFTAGAVQYIHGVGRPFMYDLGMVRRCVACACVFVLVARSAHNHPNARARARVSVCVSASSSLPVHDGSRSLQYARRWRRSSPWIWWSAHAR